MMVLSRATTKVDRQRPKVRMASLNDFGYFVSSSSPGAPPSVDAVAVESVRTTSFRSSPSFPVATPVSSTTSFSFPDDVGVLRSEDSSLTFSSIVTGNAGGASWEGNVPDFALEVSVDGTAAWSLKSASSAGAWSLRFQKRFILRRM